MRILYLLCVPNNRLDQLKNAGFSLYSATKFDVTNEIKAIKEQFSSLEPGEESGQEVSLAGRIVAIREHGGIVFVDLVDSTDKIQLVLRKDITNNFENSSLLRVYDIIGLRGRVIRTRRGELSILVEDYDILVPCLTRANKVNPEYPVRVLALMTNRHMTEAMKNLSRLMEIIRQYLWTQGYLEVPTPAIVPVHNGALSKPFVVHVNAIDRDCFLSVAPETYLKRAVVVLQRPVFDIAKCFRNEDIDTTHHPEFHQLEIYVPYKDYSFVMNLAKDLIQHVAKELLGDLRIRTSNGIIDLSGDWPVYDMIKTLNQRLGLDVLSLDVEELLAIARDYGIETQHKIKGKIIEKLFEGIIKPELPNDPYFVTGHPMDISPLAKESQERPGIAERFELFINHMEIANGYSEQNDPEVQRKAFEEQERMRSELGEEEYISKDQEYIETLKIGLPPTAGLGIGMERLLMVLFGIENIRHVIPFPLSGQYPKRPRPKRRIAVVVL